MNSATDQSITFNIDKTCCGQLVRHGPLATTPLAKWISAIMAFTNKNAQTPELWETFPYEALWREAPAFYAQALKAKRTFPWLHEDNLPDPPIISSDEPPASPIVGLIGRQLVTLVEGTGETTVPCELLLEARHDLKIIRLSTGPGRHLAPFAYVGPWSHDKGDSHEIEVTAAAVLWTTKTLRKAVIDWLEQKSPFIFDQPPLAHYVLSLSGTATASNETSGLWTFRMEAGIRLPHLLFGSSVAGNDKVESPRIIGAIPSMVRLQAPPVEGSRPKRRLFGRMFNKHVQLLQKSPDPRVLLVASPHIRAALAELSELWTDRSVRSVLLIAPPGSGKEELVKFLHAGSTYFSDEALWDTSPKAQLAAWERITTPLVEIPFAGVTDITSVRSVLFGRIEPGGSDRGPFDCAIAGLSGEVWRGGLVQDARGTTIFLDEIDKCKEGVRAGLLRFLENDEILPEKAQRSFRLDDLETDAKNNKFRRLKPRVLFAGSGSRAEILMLKPKDFWTRIQKIIEIPHPFAIHDRIERTRCIQQYVLLFLYRTVAKRLKARQLADTDPEKTLLALLEKILEGEEAGVSDSERDLILNNVDKYPFFYLVARDAEKFTGHVAAFLSVFAASVLSVRIVGATVKQLDYRLQLYFKSGIDLLAAEEPAALKPVSGVPRYLDRSWIWGNLHQITLSLLQ